MPAPVSAGGPFETRPLPRLSILFPPPAFHLVPWLNCCISIIMKTTMVPISVLIVDDDKDLCRLLQASLPSKISVHVEHTLSEAETYLTHHKPSLLFLDNSLPDGKGLSFIKEVFKLDDKIKIVMMTADTFTGLEDQAIQLGASYFISKPFRLSRVRDILFSIFPNLSAA